jgi:hypothetical protein
MVRTEYEIDIGGNFMNKSTNIAPAMNSTSGYCQDILDLQLLHAPFWAKKLKSGMSSYQESFFPQVIHFDRPPKEVPVLYLIATTFKKLPTSVPKMKATRVGYKGMYFVS